ncbi:hypothetical protein MASR2M15_19090 [Anaerolineales bacterium]
MMKVSIFGSANISAEHPVYQETYQLASELGKRACTILTGGYGGVMEAASRGAAEQNGHVVGVTLNYFSNLRGGPNRWVNEEIIYERLQDRIDHLVVHADAYIAMGGGVGTAQEIIEVWQRKRMDPVLRLRPLILVGQIWREVMSPLQNSIFVPDPDRDMIQFANQFDDVLTLLGLGVDHV